MLASYRKFYCFIVVFVCLLFPIIGNRDIPLDEGQLWNVYGRVRLRFEQDNDKNPALGTRTRVRIGNFVGVRFTPDAPWEFNVRGRAGDRRDSRIVDSTFYTREDFSYGQRGVFVDQYFARYTNETNVVTIGRASMPFWSNTEKLWDEDLTPIGGSMVSKLTTGSNAVTLSLGSFHMPDGMEYFHAWMHAAQLGWAQSGNDWNWRLALALYKRSGDEGARYLPLGQGERDYLFGVLSARLSGKLIERPAYVGIDFFENFENYSSTDPDFWTRTYRDETTGLALAFNLGENRKKGDWRFRYVYARVEWLAAMSSYATTSFGWLQKSNVIVHDIRADYSITDKWKVTGRISPAKEIIGSRESTRFRIDFSRSF